MQHGFAFDVGNEKPVVSVVNECDVVKAPCNAVRLSGQKWLQSYRLAFALFLAVARAVAPPLKDANALEEELDRGV